MTAVVARTADPTTEHPALRPSTRTLLISAVLTGPVFFGLVILQMIVRDGFDLRVHPISQLATGSLGWIQSANFALAGAGVLALAIARRRLMPEGLGRRLVPILVGVFGAGLIIAGVFVMDPQFSFPAGAPEGPVETMSWHSIVHSAAAAIAYTALAAACIVLVVRAIRLRELLPAIGNGIVGLILLLPMSPTESSLQIAFNGLVAFAWTAVQAWRLRRLV